MSFFPDDAPPPEPPEPVELPQPAWAGPPEDVLPGAAPLALVIGRSAGTVVMLNGVRAYPTGLALQLNVRLRERAARRDLNGEVFDGPYDHEQSAQWRAGRLKWGFELSDGRRVTNVDHPGWPWRYDTGADDDGPSALLVGQGGGASNKSADRDYWLWPLPPAGPLRVVCQWLDQGIELTSHQLDATPLVEAAARATPLWTD